MSSGSVATEKKIETHKWTCEKCGRSNTVKFSSTEKPFEILDIIKESHNTFSPECEEEVSNIKCVKIQ